MPRMPNGSRKKRLNVTVNPEAYDWLMSKIDSHEFANQSHAVEYCIFKAMECEEEGR